MRELPLSVWKARRIVVIGSTSSAGFVQCGRSAARRVSSTSRASSRKISRISSSPSSPVFWAQRRRRQWRHRRQRHQRRRCRGRRQLVEPDRTRGGSDEIGQRLADLLAHGPPSARFGRPSAASDSALCACDRVAARSGDGLRGQAIDLARDRGQRRVGTAGGVGQTLGLADGRILDAGRRRGVVAMTDHRAQLAAGARRNGTATWRPAAARRSGRSGNSAPTGCRRGGRTAAAARRRQGRRRPARRHRRACAAPPAWPARGRAPTARRASPAAGPAPGSAAPARAVRGKTGRSASRTRTAQPRSSCTTLPMVCRSATRRYSSSIQVSSGCGRAPPRTASMRSASRRTRAPCSGGSKSPSARTASTYSRLVAHLHRQRRRRRRLLQHRGASGMDHRIGQRLARRATCA